MVSPSNIVNGSIVANVNSLQQAGFGTPLILGNSSTSIAKGGFNIFTNMIGVASVFASSDPEYIEANQIFSQNPTVQQIFIGRELDRVAQISTIVFSGNIVVGDTVHGTINDTTITVPFNTSNTQTLTDIAAAYTISGVSSAVSDGSHTITITSAIAGIPFALGDVTVTGGGTPPTAVVDTTTDNIGFAESLNSIANVNNQFYAVIWCERTKADVLYAFDVIEASPYFYMTVSNDPNILDPASTTDIGYLCKNSNYGRSAVWYSAVANTQPIDGAVFGKNLPNPPGKVNWAFTQLNGVAVDNLNQSQYAAALAKNVNVYVPFANVDLTYKGTCGSGLYIDYRIGIDWMNSAMVTALFNTIAQLITGNKVPYSDAGVSSLEAAMYGVLEQGSQNQFIAGGLLTPSNPTGYLVGALPVSQIPQNDVANRYYPSLTFQATFVGAIDSCTYFGTISLP